jgi:hypothetical protein
MRSGILAALSEPLEPRYGAEDSRSFRALVEKIVSRIPYPVSRIPSPLEFAFLRLAFSVGGLRNARLRGTLKTWIRTTGTVNTSHVVVDANRALVDAFFFMNALRIDRSRGALSMFVRGVGQGAHRASTRRSW